MTDEHPEFFFGIAKHPTRPEDVVDVYYGTKLLARLIGVDKSEYETPERPQVDLVVYSKHLAIIEHITSREYGDDTDAVGIKFHFDANRKPE